MNKNNTPILEQRYFNLEDGDRYLVVIRIDNKNYAFTRKFKDKPIMSPEFREAKTFKNRSTAESLVRTILEPGGYNFTIFQVKDLFEPRYYIEYRNRIFEEPNIRCYQNWYVKGENPVNTYPTREQAREVLEKYKLNLLHYYHSRIMELKTITI